MCKFKVGDHITRKGLNPIGEIWKVVRITDNGSYYILCEKYEFNGSYFIVGHTYPFSVDYMDGSYVKVDDVVALAKLL